jgi:hypothetical protein
MYQLCSKKQQNQSIFVLMIIEIQQSFLFEEVELWFSQCYKQFLDERERECVY